MMNIKVEYFGPSKTFTLNKEFDLLQISTDKLFEVFEKLASIYGVEFVKYIFTSCGVVVNVDYIEIGSRELALDMDEENYKSVIGKILHGHMVEDGDVIVIVPPVSSG